MPLINLQASDGKIIPVDLRIAKRSGMIKTMFETLEVNVQETVNVPLPNVTSDTLFKVLEWAKQHRNDLEPLNEEDDGENPLDNTLANREVPQWDYKFLIKLNQTELFDLMKAANYMEVKDLLNVSCLFVANMMKGKSSEEIRRTFSIKNDLTAEEEQQIRSENEWCEEEK